MLILAINSGGSSFKYRVYALPEGKELARGLVDRIGSDQATLTHTVTNQAPFTWQGAVPDHRAALELALSKLIAPETGVVASLEEFGCFAHKLIHGGPSQPLARRLDAQTLKALEGYNHLAPLHTPFMLLGAELCLQAAPQVPQVGVFETSFHRTLPPKAYTYALPAEWCERYGLRRFGFHSMSHSYLAQRVPELLGKPKAEVKQINCHLGSGSSVCAIRGGESVDISSGFSPEAGVPMSTRPGDYDAEALLYVMEREGLSRAEVLKALTARSGLLAISGVSGDLRDLEAAAAQGHQGARLALEVLVYSVQKYIGAYLAALEGADALVFSGGIGENSSTIRERICSAFGFLGLRLDPQANATAKGEARISTPDSTLSVFVVPTNEELMVAQAAYEVLQSES